MKKNLCFNINDTAMVTVTRFGFLKGEIVSIIDPKKVKIKKEYFLKVQSVSRVGLINKKYLKKIK